MSDACDTWGSPRLPRCSSNRCRVPVPPSCHAWGQAAGLHHGATRDRHLQQPLVVIWGSPMGESGRVFVKHVPPAPPAPATRDKLPLAGQLGDGAGRLEGPGGALGSVLGALLKAWF